MDKEEGHMDTTDRNTTNALTTITTAMVLTVGEDSGLEMEPNPPQDGTGFGFKHGLNNSTQ